MKVTKEGNLKLAKNELRCGNFVYRNESTHIKIFDINSQITHRVGKHLNIGRMIEIAIKEKNEGWLNNYAAMLWFFSNIVTDEQFFLDIDKACVDCVNRHKEFYGIDENIGVEKDNEILEESKGVYEAIDEFNKEHNGSKV